MMKLILVCIILIVVLLTQNVSADSFQDFPVRLKHSPVFCAYEPNISTDFVSVVSPSGIKQELLDITKYAVLDWNTKLNLGNEKHHLWNLTLIEVPLSEQAEFDSSKCDISIGYYQRPDVQQLQYAATGITLPNFETGKTRIEIYYEQIAVGSKYVEWRQGSITYYTYLDIPYYTGALASANQLNDAIRHEIGHSLGLGHYIVAHDQLQRIVNGQEDIPSVMIPVEIALGATHFDITPADIAEIKLIYGLNGIGTQTPLNQYHKVPVIEIDKTNYLSGDTVKIRVDTSNFDDTEYAQLMTLDPSNKMIDTFTVSKSNSTFTFNNEVQTGTYYVELIDPYKDLYDFTSFTVSSGQNKPQWTKNDVIDNDSNSQNSIFSNSVRTFQSNSYIDDLHHFSITPPSGWALMKPREGERFVVGFQKNGAGFAIQDLGFPQVKVEDRLKLPDKELGDSLSDYIVSNIATNGVIEKSLFRYSDGIKFKIIFTQSQNSGTIQSENIFFWPKDGDQYYFMFNSDPDSFAQNSIEFEGAINSFQIDKSPTQVTLKSIPSWVKNNAMWWYQGQVGDDDFVKGIQYLIQQGILKVPQTTTSSQQSQHIPSWVKSTAGWWANGQVSDDEFVKGIQWLISNGIIKINS